MDPSYRHQTPKRSTQGRHGQDQGTGQNAGQGRRKTPRRRSRRGERGPQQDPQQGLQHQLPVLPSSQSLPYFPPGNWQAPHSMGPYPGASVHGAAAIAQPAMAPPPPPPPSVGGTQVAPEQVWLQQMQQMPVLATATAKPLDETESVAQQHLRNILGALQKSEETWTPEIQAAVQEVQQHETSSSMKKGHTTVSELGHAHRAVAEADAARLRLITSWRTFLQYSVARWKEYTSLFQTQEAATQTQIQTARAQLAHAQKRFGAFSDAVREGAVVISDDETDMAGHPSVKIEEVSDEATMKIADGLNQVVSSLQDLSQQAEAEEHRAKRPRKQVEDTVTESTEAHTAAITSPSMQPFGKPGAL